MCILNIIRNVAEINTIFDIKKFEALWNEQKKGLSLKTYVIIIQEHKDIFNLPMLGTFRSQIGRCIKRLFTIKVRFIIW